ncbi:hypothetical protein BMF94_6793 [Rhodotorula taiwanensis]|uniref:Protein PBN1 n=1 Tax=Rhodotorula taiwanensis TaxID=741276 RepID=A0A2S5B0A0_9BASI|nr:hypothetical protein BMF94_6793 [Rhodotorula taiwanensis]
MSAYTAAFERGGGSHPTVAVNVTGPAPACDLYAALTVPPTFIVDPCQLQRLHETGRLGDVAAADEPPSLSVSGDTDLEAPAWKTGPAKVLVRLEASGSTRRTARRDEPWRVHRVPLHLRYQPPTATQPGKAQATETSAQLELPEPVLFWACSAPGTSLVEEAGPACDLATRERFPQFANSTLYCLPSDSGTQQSRDRLMVRAPVGNLAHLALVETVTSISVWLSFAYLAYVAVRTRAGGNVSPGKASGTRFKAA